MNVVPCFTRELEPDFLVHLKDALSSKTLCGQKATAGLGGRRRVTCEACRKRKPKVLGGE